MARRNHYEFHEADKISTFKQTEKKTQHEILQQKQQLNARERARNHWELIRVSVRSALKAVEEANVREVDICHGAYIERKLNHDRQVLHVLHVPELKEYVTCDGENLYIFSEDGLKTNEVQSMEKINRIIYSSQTNRFVGWIYGQEDLYMMSEDFVVKSRAKAVDKIVLSIYNENTGELITVGPHFITCWAFRHGAHFLIPRKTYTTSFGEANMFKTMVLEDTTRIQLQRLFFTQANGIVIYNAFSGVELAHKKELHAQPVTAMAYFNPLNYIITGAQDGCIKVWDKNWKIKMVFVGHSDQINSLQIYCHGSAFISASLDCTVRVWNMNTCDEMDKVVINEPVEGLGTHANSDMFYTFAGNRVDLWKLMHLYHIHTNIGYRVQSIKVTSHPSFPQRAVVLCKDSSVRIVCPSNGEVLTTLLIKQTEGLIDAAYAIAEDTIFIVVSNGDIVKSLTNQNPCEIVSRWKCMNSQEICNCLLAYEYVVDPSASSDVWTLKQNIRTIKSHYLVRQQNIKNRTLLLGGRKDGYICVFDWHSGEVTFKAEAHGSKGVLSMTANPKSNQLISAGADNIIKVWRLYPFAQEALTPLMSFYCAHCPSFMTPIKMQLGVAFQDPSMATYCVVLYSLSEKNRFDHKPDDDHIDLITGFTSCPRMKLYASSSVDGTICVWSENNTLVRRLHLNASVHSIAFSSPHGDLLVGIDNHLFHIPHSQYLPKSYKRKQVCMRFLPVKSEQPLVYNDNRLNLMNKHDVQRLKNSYSSFKPAPSIDILISDEQREKIKEKEIKDEAFRLLGMRENEIQQIRDGALRSRNKPKSAKKTQNAAFNEYMKLFYNKDREKVVFDDDDDLNENQLHKKFAGEALLEGDTYLPEHAAYGFFSEFGQKHLEDDPCSLLHLCYPSGPSGLLPNSVLIKILYPAPVAKEVPWELRPYKPPELSLKQLAEIRGLYKKAGTDQDIDLEQELGNTLSDEVDDRLSRVLELDLTDDDDDIDGKKKQKTLKDKEMSEKSVKKKNDFLDMSVGQIGKKQRVIRKTSELNSDDDDKDDSATSTHPADLKKSSLMSRLQGIIDAPPPEKLEKAEKEKAPKPTLPPKAIKHQATVLVRPVVKMVSPLETKQPKQTLRPCTPAPVVAPLPNFISRFLAMEWFMKHFPNCNENTMPKPWTSDAFVLMICKLLQIAEWVDKVKVTDAILFVYMEEGLSESVTLAVTRNIVAVLNHQTSPPLCSVVEQKTFILAAVKALGSFGIKDSDVLTEVMVQFLVGDKDVRSTVLEMVAHLGLIDPHRQFEKELDSWEIWSIEKNRLRGELHNMSNQWLEKWMTSYKMRIKDSLSLLNQGHSLQGHISNMKTLSTQLNKTGSLTVTPGNREKSSSITQTSLTVTLDSIHGSSILESVNYLDAVSYFCEMMTEKDLESLKRGKMLKGKQGEKVSQTKNTVLVLPRISEKPALVRLGEMHFSVCRPARESTFYTADLMMQTITARGRHPAPGDMNSFVNCINLPVKTYNLNPFLTAKEKRDSQINQSILITVQLSRKYFIPSMSHVPMRGHVAVGS